MKAVRFFGYSLLFGVSFFFFLYLMFPYEILKDRLILELERMLGSGTEVSLVGLTPHYFSGVRLKGLKVVYHEQNTPSPVLSIDRAELRISLLSALLGNPRLSFQVKAGAGELRGSGKQSDGMLNLDLELRDLDVGAFPILASRYGLKLGSRIDGAVELLYDQGNTMRSSGKANLTFRSLALEESSLPMSGSSIDLPAVQIAKGRDSRIRASLGKGVITLEEFRFSGGDLSLDLQGKIFLSSELLNTRLNINGSFSDSPKLSQALPFLFIVEKQKRPDGSYPLAISGRFEKPSIRIGTFTVPL